MRIKDRIEKGEVHAIFVIELAGRPPEHIEKALHTLIDAFGKQKGVEVITQKFHKAESVEKLFSCFSEIEFLADSFSRLLNLIFYFMPSSIEIIEPKTIKVKVSDANNIANDLSSRLHQYDTMAKKMQIEKAIMIKKIQEESNQERLNQEELKKQDSSSKKDKKKK